uniref:Protein BFR2 n=1 Tax=Panagrellus redivivus TaxID=6233 RepID=A0A7E4V432_PANRE
MASLRAQLEELSNPTPALPDLEDDEDLDGTSSRKLLQKTSDALEDNESGVGARRLRQAVDLDAQDEKYRGSKVSRADLFGESSSFSLTNGKKAGSDSEADEEEDDSDGEGLDKTADFASEDESADDGDDEEVDDDDEEAVEGSDEEEDAGIKTVSEDPIGAAQKGDAVRAQLAIWDRIMHMTIKSHAALRAFNQLPRGNASNEFLKTADAQTKQNYAQLKANMFEIANLFVETDDILTSKGGKGDANKVESDEELESSEDEKDDDNAAEDEDDEAEDEEAEDEEEEEEDEAAEEQDKFVAPKTANATGHRINTLQKALNAKESKFIAIRNEILSKWDDRTRLTGKLKSKKAVVSESTIVKQIDRVLSDKYRLLRRTQAKNVDAPRLGAKGAAGDDSRDPEVFNDDDFYQHLLKEFIEQKSAQTNDPVEMSRRYIELQKLRAKKPSKQVDRSASKGKKVRYTTVPKLVNFFPARAEAVEWSHEKRNELFKSLFQ